jgi:hypothetical protein
LFFINRSKVFLVLVYPFPKFSEFGAINGFALTASHRNFKKIGTGKYSFLLFGIFDTIFDVFLLSSIMLTKQRFG